MMKLRETLLCLTLAVTALADAPCHAEGDREYCLKGFTTTSARDCHTINGELICFDGVVTKTVGGTKVSGEVLPTTSKASKTEGGHAHAASNPHSMSTGTARPMSEKDDDHKDEKKPEPKSGHSHGAAMSGAHKPEMEKEAEAKSAQSSKKEHGHGKAVGSMTTCTTKENEEYTLNLRVAAIFIILFTSSIGVLCPLVLRRYTRINSKGVLFTFIKQFGTGIIISTVFIHLLTHAVLQFENPCVGKLAYEGTVMAIAMGGAFISFLADFAGIQYLRRYHEHHGTRLGDEPDAPPPQIRAVIKSTGATSKIEQIMGPGSQNAHLERIHTSQLLALRRNRVDEEKLSVIIMESGIIFHSILVGVLLAVTPDDELPVLFTVVLIHQMFEGLALGARIEPLECVGDAKKVLMGFAFSFTAPVGMAIGIGVRKSFNGNNRNTILTIGTMDALSAGVLAWVAFVELWSKDWLLGEMRDADMKHKIVGMIALIAGLFIMSLLGKWA